MNSIFGFMEAENKAIPIPTDKDVKIISMLKNGMNGAEIAKKMGVNKNTFAFNLRVLRSKYQCKNTIQLVVLFIENKLID